MEEKTILTFLATKALAQKALFVARQRNQTRSEMIRELLEQQIANFEQQRKAGGSDVPANS